MPHLFVNRPRLHDLIGDDPDTRDQFRWESINATVYKLGGVVFIVGSILFFPALKAYADIGAWAFIVGSLMYLLVTGHDMAEVLERIRRNPGRRPIWHKIDFTAAVTYVAGTLLFLLGSVFFLSRVGLYAAGAWCFVVGSLFFVIGATINVLQIVRAADLVTLQLMNLTALTFVAGSLLFTVASIPYLFSIESAQDMRTIDAFLAWQYLIGSVLFLAGGIINYTRACLVVKKALRRERGDRRVEAA